MTLLGQMMSLVMSIALVSINSPTWSESEWTSYRSGPVSVASSNSDHSHRQFMPTTPFSENSSTPV